jgi:hypothetical protein
MNTAVVMRYYALLIGVSFTLAGIGGFLPIITQPVAPDAPQLVIEMSYGYLLGLFPINVLHNLFHLGTGIAGLLAYREIIPMKAFMQGFGTILAVLTIAGMIPMFSTGFGLFPLYGHDIWLHGLEAALALYLGFFADTQLAFMPQWGRR